MSTPGPPTCTFHTHGRAPGEEDDGTSATAVLLALRHCRFLSQLLGVSAVQEVQVNSGPNGAPPGPFSRVAMDIVGPWSGHKYVFVVCDYATKYLEAIPPKNTDAETIADELITLFTRVGIPHQTDQGANFQSQLLKRLYQLLGVDTILTSPYHPQTDVKHSKRCSR